MDNERITISCPNSSCPYRLSIPQTTSKLTVTCPKCKIEFQYPFEDTSDNKVYDVFPDRQSYRVNRFITAWKNFRKGVLLAVILFLIAIFLSLIVLRITDKSSRSTIPSYSSSSILPINSTSPPVETPPFSLANGTELIELHGQDSSGRLTVENGTDRDAVLKLITNTVPRKTTRKIYIRAHNTAIMNYINPGTYIIRYSLGVDWDQTTRKFLRSVSYCQCDRLAQYTENEGEYREYRLTLHQVVGGNLTTTPIDANVFEEDEY